MNECECIVLSDILLYKDIISILHMKTEDKEKDTMILIRYRNKSVWKKADAMPALRLMF
jgi:hypothetical protein